MKRCVRDKRDDRREIRWICCSGLVGFGLTWNGVMRGLVCDLID